MRMATRFSAVSAILLTVALPLSADDYVSIGSIPFPQVNAGANTAISFMQGQVVFLTQRAGYEDVYFINPRTSNSCTNNPTQTSLS